MRINPLFLFIVTIVITFLLPLQAAQAWGGYGYGGHYGYGHHGYGGRGYGDGYKRHYYPSYRRYSSSRYSSGKDCHSTYKYSTDEQGEKTKINGTMCYDDYGKSYIVPGSRYVADENTHDYED